MKNPPGVVVVVERNRSDLAKSEATKDDILTAIGGYFKDEETGIEIRNDTGLKVEEIISTSGEEYFLRVTINPHKMALVAEEIGIKLRVKKLYGGQFCLFRRKLRALYDDSEEGTLFSSCHFLRCIDHLLFLPPEKGGCGLKRFQEENKIKSVFWMHYRPIVDKLQVTWTSAWKKAQPLELVREYFGETIALYFTWLGYYTTSLFIPAIIGGFMTITQIYSYYLTESADNPFVPLYCIFTALWSVIFISGWKRVELQKKRLWDTLDFEEKEEEREEFSSRAIIRRNPITRKKELYMPPWKRNTALLLSIGTVVLVVCCLMLFRFLSKEWFGLLGGPVGGVSNAISIMIFNTIYGKVVDALNDFENWKTQTEHDDAKIAKDFCFKFVNAYFALFFVAFIQNNIPIFGVDMHCPYYHCMPVLMMTLGTIFTTQIFVQQSMEAGMPIVMRKMRRFFALRKKQKMMQVLVENSGGGGGEGEGEGGEGEGEGEEGKEGEGGKKEGEGGGTGGGGGGSGRSSFQQSILMSELGALLLKEDRQEQEEAEMSEYPGVFDDYNEMVIQFGYITLFAAAFPLTPLLALINNVIEIRVDATKITCETRRPKYKCSADIGTWMNILDIISTISIFTNCCLVGFTSHGLYLYEPDITKLKRLWIVVIAEHALLLLKSMLEAFLPEEAEGAEWDYKVRRKLLHRAVENFIVIADSTAVDEEDEDEDDEEEGEQQQQQQQRGDSFISYNGFSSSNGGGGGGASSSVGNNQSSTTGVGDGDDGEDDKGTMDDRMSTTSSIKSGSKTGSKSSDGKGKRRISRRSKDKQ